MVTRFALAGAFFLVVGLAAGPVAAQPPSPGGGNEFGQHIASMAPDHPRDHGVMFGTCVSTMATTETCPHHE